MTLADDIRKDRESGRDLKFIPDGKKALVTDADGWRVATFCGADAHNNALRFVQLEEAYLAALDALEKADELLGEAADDLTSYVNMEYPQSSRLAHRDIERRHHRDMDLVRRITAYRTARENMK